MARLESDREDLLAEATALVVRSEWQVTPESEPVTIGFRATGELSVYFGQDPYYQFDSDGRLRRAFDDGHLYRSQAPELIRLKRHRDADRTLLLSAPLSQSEQRLFHSAICAKLRELLRRFQQGHITLLRAVPIELDHQSRIIVALELVLAVEPWLSSSIRRR